MATSAGGGHRLSAARLVSCVSRKSELYRRALWDTYTRSGAGTTRYIPCYLQLGACPASRALTGRLPCFNNRVVGSSLKLQNSDHLRRGRTSRVCEAHSARSMHGMSSQPRGVHGDVRLPSCQSTRKLVESRPCGPVQYSNLVGDCLDVHGYVICRDAAQNIAAGVRVLEVSTRPPAKVLESVKYKFASFALKFVWQVHFRAGRTPLHFHGGTAPHRHAKPICLQPQ